MSMSKDLHQRVARLLLCVVFFAAIAPSISHFFSSVSHSKIWVELCSAYGSKRMAIDWEADQDKAPDHLVSSMSHCPFCRLQNDFPVIPTLKSFSIFALIVDEVPLESRTSLLHRISFIRTAHLTRAPPSIF